MPAPGGAAGWREAKEPDREGRRRHVKRIVFSLWASFLIAGHLAAHAESAKVEGTVSCGSIRGDESDRDGRLLPDKLVNASKAFETGQCWFNIELNGEITSDTVARVRLLLEVRSRLPLPPGGVPGGRFPNVGRLIIDSLAGAGRCTGSRARSALRTCAPPTGATRTRPS
jgi:hypothetical protein